jgi:hypothetical protein
LNPLLQDADGDTHPGEVTLTADPPLPNVGFR